MRTVALLCVCALVAVPCLTGCRTTPRTVEARADLDRDVQEAIALARRTDPGIETFFQNAAGVAVFPSVGRGAVGVGGAFGRGQLFERGQFVGYTTLSQATIGAALGGQAYTQLIFFENQEALERFKDGQLTFAAHASAVALRSGASAAAQYTDSVAVFTMGERGLMVEAAIGGQRFTFEPVLTHDLGVQPAAFQSTSQ
jgi:lipid-binding SYLF domain-containing protein